MEIYDTARHDLVRRLESPDSTRAWNYQDLAWSPDGQRLAAIQSFFGKGHQPMVQCWNLNSNDRRGRSMAGACHQLVFLRGGQVLAVADRGSMTLLDPETLAPIGERTESVYKFAVGRRGEILLALGRNGVDLWDGVSLRPRQRLVDVNERPKVWPPTTGLAVWLLVFGVSRARKIARVCESCGRRFIPAGEKETQVDCSACRLTKAQPLRGTVAMMPRSILPDRLLWLSLVGLVLPIVASLLSSRIPPRRSDDWIVAVAASADGTTLAALLHDGRLLVWDGAGTLKTTLLTRRGFSELALSNHGKLTALSREWDMPDARKATEIWNIENGELQWTIPASRTARVRFSPTDDLLAIQEEDGECVTEVLSLLVDGPPGALFSSGMCQAFSPDGKMLAVASAKGEITICDTATLGLVRAFRSQPLVSPGSLAWARDSKELSVLTVDNHDVKAPIETIETWRISGPEMGLCDSKVEVGPFTRGGQTMHSLPDGHTLVVAGPHSGLKAFNAASPKGLPSAANQPEIWQCATPLRGDTFLTSNTEGVYLWDTTTLEPRQRLFKRARPNMWLAIVCLPLWLALCTICTRRLLARRSPSTQSTTANG